MKEVYMYKDLHGFQDFKNQEQYKLKVRKSRTFNKLIEKKAVKQNVYSGKRFLGFTPNNKEVWISMKYLRSDSTLDIKVDSGFNELFKDGAVLANKRIVMKKGTKKPDVKQQMTALKKNAGGVVTIRTLNYISKLISIIESKHSKAYIRNKPTSLLFQYTSSIIYEGDIEKDIRWTDVIKFGDLPSGEYFTVDSFPKGKDN